MRTRTAAILEAAVREFIATGEPVSSAQLYDTYDFGIKPAMIRLELTELEDAGYLEQPHHSAGRVPGDRGYAFYADRVRHAVPPTTSPLPALAAFVADESWDALAAYVARQLGAFTVCGSPAAWHKEGLEQLVRHLDWGDDRTELVRVMRDVERIDDRLDTWQTDVSSDITVFVGRRSPLYSSHQLAALAARYGTRDRPITIVAIGPRRIDYEKSVALFRQLETLLSS